MPLHKRSSALYGPLEATYRSIIRDDYLVDCLNAVERRLNRPMRDIVCRMCFEYYAPEQTVAYVRAGSQTLTKDYHQRMLDFCQLRKKESKDKITHTVIRALKDWIAKNVKAIDTRGNAVFFDDPSFDNPEPPVVT